MGSGPLEMGSWTLNPACRNLDLAARPPNRGLNSPRSVVSLYETSHLRAQMGPDLWLASIKHPIRRSPDPGFGSLELSESRDTYIPSRARVIGNSLKGPKWPKWPVLGPFCARP